MLLPIANLLSRAEVDDCRQLLAQGQWQEGKLTAGGQAAGVKANLQLNDDSDLGRQLQQFVLERLHSHPVFISAVLPKRIFPPKFNCYQDGGHYGLHVDNALLTTRDQQWLRSDVSATLFLTDPATYDGGDLVIETAFGAQTVKLEAGSLILYPSSSLHEVTPVTRGQRISAFFWTQSLVRTAAQREQLFDLDQTIQVLTAERGSADPQVRSLTGLYHNLLRSWAES